MSDDRERAGSPAFHFPSPTVSPQLLPVMSTISQTLSLFPTPTPSRSVSPTHSVKSARSRSSSPPLRSSSGSTVTTRTRSSTNPTSTAWPLNAPTPPSPVPEAEGVTYASYLQDLVPSYPHLRPLTRFLSNPSERVNSLPITTLDLRTPPHPPITRHHSASSPNPLSTVIARLTPATVTSRTIICPYLTPALVCLLGAQFELDPDFFLPHVPGGARSAPKPLSSDPYQRLPLPPGGKAELVSIYHCEPTPGTLHTTTIILLSVRDEPTMPSGLVRRASRYQKPRYSDGRILRERSVVEGIVDGMVSDVEGVMEGVVREWAGFLERMDGMPGGWESWLRDLSELAGVVEVGKGDEARRRALRKDVLRLEGMCRDGAEKAMSRRQEEEMVREEMIRERQERKEGGGGGGGFLGLFGCVGRRKETRLGRVNSAPARMRAESQGSVRTVTAGGRYGKDSGCEVDSPEWRSRESWSTIGKAT